MFTGQSFQSPQFIPDLRNQKDGVSRSTVVQKGDRWQLVEMTELIDAMEDQECEIEELKGQYMAKIVTSVAPSTVAQAPEDLGFELGVPNQLRWPHCPIEKTCNFGRRTSSQPHRGGPRGLS